MHFAPEFCGSGNQFGFVLQQVVQTAGQIIARFQCGQQDFFPRLGNDPATVRHANDQRFGTRLQTFLKRHIGQLHIRAATLHPELANSVVRAPVLDALRHFCGQLVRRVAKEKQIGCLDHDGSPFWSCVSSAQAALCRC